MATDTNDGRTVLLKGVRLSFTDALVEKKKSAEDADPKHNCNIILEASSKHFAENQKKCFSAMRAAGEKAWKNPEAFKAIAEDNPKRVCFKKGERFKNKESGEVYEGYAGNWAMSATGPNGGQKRPVLKDRHKRDVEAKDIADVFYSGTRADVYVSFFGTDKGSRGIFATVDLIRSHQEGDRMAGGFVLTEDKLNALDDLDDDLDDAPSGNNSSSSSSDGDSDFG